MCYQERFFNRLRLSQSDLLGQIVSEPRALSVNTLSPLVLSQVAWNIVLRGQKYLGLLGSSFCHVNLLMSERVETTAPTVCFVWDNVTTIAESLNFSAEFQ